MTGLPGAALEVGAVAQTADWRPVVEVPPDTTQEFRVFVTVPRGLATEKSRVIWIKAADLYGGESASAKDNFFAP